MQRVAYHYKFTAGVDMSAVTETLLLAVTAAEGLHGRAKVNLDAEFDLDEGRRECRIGAGNDVGRDIARIFVGFLSSDVGEEAFQVRRVNAEVVPS